MGDVNKGSINNRDESEGISGKHRSIRIPL